MNIFNKVLAGLFVLMALNAHALTIKDVAAFEGERPNQLIGYGLVVGLDGTGDQTNQAQYTAQSLQAMIARMGVVLPPGTVLQSKNVAAVMLSAMLPAFSTAGQQIDVTVSAIGNSKSLRGGTLILSSLKGVDGEIYAMAQGPLVLGTSAGRGLKAHENVARLPSGGIIERSAPNFNDKKRLVLVLHNASWEMSSKINSAIIKEVGVVSKVMDSRKIEILLSEAEDTPAIAAKITSLPIKMEQSEAKIVINARTGSIVLGQGILVGECAISHGNISIAIGPNPAGGVQEAQRANVALVSGSATLSDVVKTLNSLGATPQDVISIVQAMKDAGALNAIIEVI